MNKSATVSRSILPFIALLYVSSPPWSVATTFLQMQTYSSPPDIHHNYYTHHRHCTNNRHALSTRIKSGVGEDIETNDDDNNNVESSERRIANDLGLDIVRGSKDDISDERWGDIEGGAPSRWMVMKNVSRSNVESEYKLMMNEFCYYVLTCFLLLGSITNYSAAWD